jgi:enoyl-CoA hydratase/carnithine racemase
VGRAKELMYLGEPIDAETALRWGLLNRLVPPGQALAQALELARTLAARPNRALQLMKRPGPASTPPRTPWPAPPRAMLSSDRGLPAGVRAFFAKEPPRFRHR